MREVILNLSVAVLSLAIFFAGIETGFRAVRTPDQDRARAGYVVEDRDLIWRLKPQTEGPLITNRLGLRDGPYNENADLKILALGDSVTWGEAIHNQQQLYTSLLEDMLQEKYPDIAVEVINAGVPGYSTFQERLYLELYGLDLQPDLVVLQFCLNDVTEPYHTLAALGGDNRFLGIDTRQAAKGAFGWLLRHSVAFEWTVKKVQRLLRKREEYNVVSLCREPLSVELSEAWERAFAELDRVVALTSAQGIPFVLLGAPYQFQTVYPDQTGQPQRRLMDYAGSRGTDFLDLLPYFAASAKEDPQPLFFDANHFTPRGHRITADVLSEKISLLLAGRGKGSTASGGGIAK